MHDDISGVGSSTCVASNRARCKHAPRTKAVVSIPYRVSRERKFVSNLFLRLEWGSLANVRTNQVSVC